MHYPDKTGRHEPYESRDSRADLWGPEAEMPPATRQSFRVACAYCGQKVWLPIGHNVACPKCREVMDVRPGGGVPGIRPVRAVQPEAPALDSRGRTISRD